MALQPRQAGKKFAPGVIVYGEPGSCKTTFGAFAPNPSFLITENGIDTLRNNGLVPACDVYEASTWNGYLSILKDMEGIAKGGSTLVIDTLNGLQRMCYNHTRNTNYGGDQSKFDAFQKGKDMAVIHWDVQFPLLDKLREKGMMVILLAHAAVKKVKNPGGEDYDVYSPQLEEKMTEKADAWADQMLFLHWKATTMKDGLKHKAVAQELQLVCKKQPYCKAKNRSGLPDFIEVPDEKPVSVFKAWADAMIASRKANEAANKPPEPTTAA